MKKGDIVICKKTHKVSNFELKRGYHYLILDHQEDLKRSIPHIWDANIGFIFIQLEECEDIRVYFKETGRLPWKIYKLSIIENLGLNNLSYPYFYDYFYTVSEMRKLKLNKIREND